MRTVGMGVSPASEEDKKLHTEIDHLKAENMVLKQEIADLKARKVNKKTRAEGQDPTEE